MALSRDMFTKVDRPDIHAIERMAKNCLNSAYTPDDGYTEYELARACEELIAYINTLEKADHAAHLL